MTKYPLRIKKLSFILVLLAIFITLGAIVWTKVGESYLGKGDSKVSKEIEDYLQSEKLSHIEVSGEPYSYVLDKSVIERFPKKWMKQTFDYNNYLGKTITEYEYSGHGLEYQGGKYNSVCYNFITCEGELLGGTVYFATAEQSFWLNLKHNPLE